MNITQLASLCATLSGISAIGALIAIGLFFAGKKVFGPINDSLLGLMGLMMLPIAIGLNQIESPGAIRLIVMIAGIIAMLTLAVHQVLLVTGKVHINNYDRITELPLAILNGSWFVIGLWLIAVSYFGRNVAALPKALIVAGIVTGIGLAGMPIAYWRGGMRHPLTYLTGILWQIGYPIWAIWLGNLLAHIK